MKRIRAWKKLAQECAYIAHEHEFYSRRGIYGIEDLDVLVVYNNQAYADNPLRRDRELAKFREALKREGVKELAFASYPTTGESDGYNFAMLIDAPVAQQAHFASILQEITLQEMTR